MSVKCIPDARHRPQGISLEVSKCAPLSRYSSVIHMDMSMEKGIPVGLPPPRPLGSFLSVELLGAQEGKFISLSTSAK